MTSTFWLLQPSGPPKAEKADGTEYERVTCPANSGHRRAGKRTSDLWVTVTPSGVRDFTWIWGGELLVSQRVLQLFAQHRVIGFEAVPANVSYRKKCDAPPPVLYELVVSGWGGLAAAAAGVTVASWCPACGFKQYEIANPAQLIDVAAWDGSDLFFVWPLPRHRFVNDRLANILRREKVSGVKLIPASEIPLKCGASATPGQLAFHMPERRARELEGRFGLQGWLLGSSGT